MRQAITLAIILAPSMATAQSYPSRSIRVIVPSLPGGNLDLVARTISAQMALGFKQQVVVENRAGATLGARFVDRKSTRLNSSHGKLSRMPSSA